MKKYWFKAKSYGWGWTPATWQGWLVTLVFIVLIVTNFFRLDTVSDSVSDTFINFFPETFALVGILLLICYKTGEKPEWRWGNKDKKSK